MYAILIYIVLGQTAEPYAPIALPYVEVEQPQLPANAVSLMLSPGRYVHIVPEEPILETIYRTETKTRWVSTCGMPCSVHVKAINETVRVPVGKEPMNAPTPLAAIERILKTVGLRSDDVLADLGCGDGRVCIVANALTGCRTIALDNRKAAWDAAMDNCIRNHCLESCEIKDSTLDWQDFREATVVYAYLIPETMRELRIPTTVRMGISYKHPWPGVKCEQIGDFYVWKRPQKLETAAKRPEIRVCAGGS